MRKFLIIFLLIIFTVPETLAYAIKVYDEYGNRVGTYRKVGQSYQFYDFYDKKVDNPEALIKNPPDKRTLTEYTQTLYDENMMPIGTYRSGFYENTGRYYPRRYYPTGWSMAKPYIVRPNNNKNYLQYADYQETHSVDTRFARFHKFSY